MSMKFWIVCAFVLATGVGLGAATTFLEFKDVTEIFDSRQDETTEYTGGPRVAVLNGAGYDFGSMERFAKRDHSFIIKNEGTEPLTLKQEGTTCKCTLSSLDQVTVAPNEEFLVTLEWTAKEMGPDNKYQQRATIATNDPTRKTLTLSVFGTIKQTTRAFPPEITVNALSSQGAEVDFHVISFSSDEPLKITNVGVTDPSLNTHLSVELKPLPEEILKEKSGKSGVAGTVKIKPGLPIGNIQQLLRLTTNLPGSPIIEVPILAVIASDILIFGNGYSREQEILTMPTVKSADGGVAKLNFLIKGDHRATTKFKVANIEPSEVFQVKIGEGKMTNNNSAVLVPVTIEIKKGAKPVSYLSSQRDKLGFISLTSNHPQMKTKNLYIRFAVER